MKKLLLLAVIAIIQLSQFNAYAKNTNNEKLACTPAIATGTVNPNTICAGTIISVPYTFTDCVDAGNVFTVELSNAAGSFASPTIIGSVASISAGSITATIPGSTSFGSGYRVRVVASAPATTGTDNGIDLVILPKPNASYSINNASQCFNNNSFNFTNTSTGSIAGYKWTLGDGISTNNTSITAYNYAVAGTYNVTLTATGTNGCKDSSVQTITVQPKPVVNFTPSNANPCSSSNFLFTNNSTIASGSQTFVWSFGDGNTATTTNPNNTYAAAGVYTVKLVASSNNGCKDSISKTINVLDKPVASFLVNNQTQCLNGNGFNFPNFSTGVGNTYFWSFGDGTTSTSVNPTKNYFTAGTFTVKLIATNINGCSDSTTKSVIVNANPASSFSASGNTLCSSTLNVPFTNSTAGVGNTYFWDFGDGNTSTATNPSNTYSSIGSYNVKLVTTNASGCKDSITQTITIANKPTAAFTINNNSQCVNSNLFTFNNTTTSGTFSSSFWDFGDGVTSNLTNPSKAFSVAGNYNIKLVVTNANGCKDSTTQVATVVDKPTAIFNINGNTSCSSTLNVSFNNTSIGSGNTYFWKFGDGTTSTATNPTKTYATTGFYIIRLIVSNSFGCKDSTERSVTFATKPTAAFAVNVNNQCVNNNTFTFTNNSVGGASYFWDFGDGITSTVANPTKQYVAAGIYIVQLITTNSSGCTDTASQTITIVDKPVASFTTVGATNCTTNLSIGFVNNSTGVGNTYLWSFGDGTTSTATTPTKTYASTGIYTIKLVTTNSNGCKDSTSQSVTFSAKSVAAFIVNNASQCGNSNSFSFNNTSTGTVVSNFWNFGDGTTSTTINPTKTYNVAGTYTVTLIVTNASSCQDTTTKTVTVLAAPIAAFTTTGTTGCTNNLTIGTSNTSSGTGLTYLWTFGDGNTSTSANPSNTYATAGTYNIKLVVTSSNGCKDSVTSSVTFSNRPTASYLLIGASSQCSNNNSYQFQDASTGATSYFWNFGNGTTSSLQNPPAFSYATAGTYTITHIVSNAAGCSDTIVASNAINILVSPIAAFNLTYQGCTKTVSLSQINNANTSFSSWDFGDGSAVQNNTPTTTHTYASNGTYNVKFIAYTAGFACKDSSIQIVQFTTNPVAIIGRTGAPLVDCYNKGRNSFDYVSNSNFATSYFWDFGNGMTSTLQDPAGISYNAPGTYTVKLVVANAQGCKDSTIALSDVRKSPVGAIQIVSGATGCTNNLTLGLIDSLSNDNLKSGVSWNFGDGGTSVQPNPLKTYATQGTYTITLITSGSNASGTLGCVDTTSRIVSFFKLPSVSILNTSPTTQCLNGNSYNLSDGLAQAASWSWNFGDGTVINGINVIHSYANAGNYTITETATSNQGCKDSAKVNVSVLPNPNAAFTATYQACNNLTAQFAQTNTTNTVHSAWYFGDGNGPSDVFTTSHTYAAVGTYTVKYFAYDATFSCVDSAVQIVTFGANPVLNITTTTPTTQCLTGNSFTFRDLSNATATHSWTLGDGNTRTGTTPTSFSYAVSGTYPVKEIVTTTLGCKDSATINVTVLQSPLPAFTSSAQSCSSLNIQFVQTNTIPTSSAIWYFGDGTTSTTPYLVSHTYATPGTYTVKYVASAATCKDSASQSITINAIPNASFTVNNNAQCINGNNFIFTNTSTGAATYSWNFGDGATSTLTSPTHTYTIAGTYNVQLIASNGTSCNDTTTVTVTVNSVTTATFSFTGNTNCTNNLTLAFTATNQTAASYSWSFGDGTTSTAINPTKTYLSIGTYTVKLVETNANGCKDSTTQTITFSTPTVPTFAVNNTTQCVNGNNFIFTNNTIGASSNSWNFGDGSTSTLTSPTHTYTAAGVYIVKLIITNTTGCIDSMSTTITVNAKPSGAFTHTGGTGCTNNLALTFTATTQGSASYMWSFGDGTTSTATNPTKTYATTGTYIVKLVETNANGCKDSSTQTISFTTPATASFAVNNATQCVNGNNFAFTNNSVGAISYLYNFGDGATSTLQSPTHTYTTAGTYTVKLFATNAGGCTDSTTATVVVNAKPTVAFTHIGATSCTSNLTLAFTNTSTGIASSAWSFGDGTTSTATNPTKTYTTTGTYIVKLVVTNANGCKDSLSEVITFTGLPTAAFVVNSGTQCVNSNSFVFTNNSVNAATYTWTFGDGTTSSLQSPTHTYTTAGTYTVKLFATNAGGCADSTTAIVVVNAKPTVAFTHTGATSCTSNLTLAFNNTSTNVASSVWSFGDGTTSSATNPTKTYSTAGTYIVKLVVTNANGCKDSTTETITFSNTPTAAFNVVGSATCSSSLGIAFNNTSTGNIASYLWNFGDGTTSTLTSPTKLYSVAGGYTIKLIVTSVNGCKDSTSQVVSVSTRPAVSFTIPTFDSCSKTLAISLTNTTTNAISYSWSFGDGTTSTAINPTKTYAAAGTYTIKLVAINVNGCKDSATQTITLLPKPVANFSVNASTLCLGTNVTFTNTSTALSATSYYYWDFGDGTFSLLQSPTKAYITNGTFKVLMYVTNLNGCKDSISKQITITSKPVASFIIPNYNSCSNGGSFNFTNTSTGAASYAWDFGDGSGSTLQNPTKVYASAGTYTIRLVATNASGCSDTTQQTITLSSKPIAAYTASANSNCANSAIAFTDASTNLSATAYYYWDFGDGTFSLLQNPTKVFSTAGTYKVLLYVTNLNGCKDSISRTFTVVAKPTASFTTPFNNGCSNNNTIAFTNTSTGAVSYAWDFGDGSGSTLQNPTKVYASQGTYTIKLTVTNAGGCKDSISQTISLLPKPIAAYNASSNSNCANTAITFTDASTNLSATSYYYWDFGDGTFSLLQNPTKVFSTAGTYKVLLYVTNLNGCKDSISKSFTVVAKPTASFTTPFNNGCSNNNTISFTNTSTGAVAYAWDFGDGSGSTLQNPTKVYASQGTYTIKLTVTNAGGCKDSISQTISLLPKPIAAYNASSNSNCANTAITFTDASTNLSSPAYYYWDFGDGTFSLLQNPVKVFSTVGTYKVLMYVTNLNGCKDSISKVFTMVAKPTASFTTPFGNGCSNNNTISFVNNSTGAVSYTWDFGDGTTSNVQNPTKTYASQGTYTIKLTVTNAGGCIDITTQTISLLPKPTAAYNASANSSCANSTITFTDASTGLSTPSYYYWDFGDGTFSLLQNPTKVYTNTGTYRVLMYVTNLNGCKDSISKSFTMVAKPTASFTTPFGNGCSNNNTISFVNNSTGAVSYTWDFGDGTTSNVQNPTKTYTSQGTYTIKLTVTNAGGCIDVATQTISLLPKPVAAFNASSINGCTSTTINFTDASTALSSTSYYYWDFGDGTFSTAQNPTKTYTTAGTYKVLFFVTNLNGCKDSISKNITIATKPIAAFTTPNNGGCASSYTFSFVNGSSNATGYTWDFGNGNGSNLANPTYTYPAQGVYTVTLVATNASGCTDTARKIISLLPKPTAAFTANATSQCLSSNSFAFTSNAANAVSYFWSFGDGTTSTLQNPVKTYASTGTYTVTLTVTNSSNCTDATTQTIAVVGKPNVNFSINNASQCIFGNVFTFTNTSANTGGVSYFWNFGDGILSTQTSISKSYASAGTYNVTLIATNGNGCIDSVTKTVTVLAKPAPSFTSNGSNQCVNNVVVFTNTTTTTVTGFVWKFGDGTTSTALNPTHVYANSGTYQVTLIALNSGGCVDSVTQPVFIVAKPIAGFTFVTNTNCNGTNSVSFTNTTVNGFNSVLWSFGDGTFSTVLNPAKSYATAGTYFVKLLVISNAGCRDSIVQAITIAPKTTASFASNTVTQCVNNNSFTFTSTSTGLNSLSYLWDLGDGTFASTSTVTKSYLLPGTFTVKLVVTNIITGCKDSVSQQVQVSPQPVASFVGSGTICSGNSFIINVSLAGTPPYSFTYTDGTNNYFVGGINTGLYGLAVSPTATTTYRMIAMNDARCSASTATIAATSSTVTVNTATFTLQPANTAACLGSSITLSGLATANTTFSYQWQKNGIDILGETNSTLVRTSVTNFDSGTYRLAVIMPCGVVYSNNAALSVLPPAAPPAFPATVTLCQYDSARPLTASGTILKWYTTATGGIGSVVAPMPNTLTTGTQQYWVSNSTANNCESPRYLITVTILPSATITLQSIGRLDILPSQTVLLQASTSATAVGVRWYKNGQVQVGLSGNQVTVGFNDLGTYYAEAINNNGCTTRSEAIEIKARGGFAPANEGVNAYLYPNPATNAVNMYFDNPLNENATVRLVNMWGQVLQTKAITFTKRFQLIQMNVSNLRADAYALEVINSKGFTIARNLFVKSK